MSAVEHRRYYALDGMRGLAAIMVVLHHFGLQVDPRLAASGYLAVDFFFALSGFVIALAYQDRLGGGLSVRRFMLQRVIRLYPLFLIGILIGLVKAVGQIVLQDGTALSMPTLLMTLITAPLMLPTPGMHLVSIFPLNTPGWSLFFEMLVSLAFGAFLFRWRNSSLALAAAIAGMLLLPGMMSHDGRVASLGTNWPDFAYGFSRVFFSFLVGVLIFRVNMDVERRVSGDVHIAIIVLIALLLGRPGSWLSAEYDGVVLLLGIPAILWAGAVWEVPEHHQRFFAWLGDISYPLYILHFPLLMMYLFVMRHSGIPVAFLGIFFLAAMLMLATLILRLYDEPARAMLSIRFRMPGSCRFRRPSTMQAELGQADNASAHVHQKRNHPPRP